MEDLNKKLDKIVSKLEHLDSRLDSVDKTLVEQAGDLKHHIYRSNLNEENIELLRADVKPLQRTHEQVSGMLKLLGMAVTGVAMIAGIVKILEFTAGMFK